MVYADVGGYGRRKGSTVQSCVVPAAQAGRVALCGPGESEPRMQQVQQLSRACSRPACSTCANQNRKTVCLTLGSWACACVARVPCCACLGSSGANVLLVGHIGS